MLVLLHLLMASPFTEAQPVNSRLLQVQIIIRHSDRAPLFEYTSSESAKLYSRGLGELSNEGLLRAALQGAAFKHRYSELSRMSGTNDDETKIYVRSSPIKRSLMSAAAFSTAFTGSMMPPVHTTENLDEEKVLIIHHSIEHRCKVLARHNIHDQPFCRMTPFITLLVKEYPECAGYPYPKIEAALAEVVNSAVSLDDALEKCARGDARRIQFRSLSVRPGVGREFDAVRLRAVIGPLMAIVSRNVDDVVASGLSERVRMNATVRIYYTHDHVILAVAQALGILSEFDERSPAFSSAIAIETWSSDEGFDVKIVLKDGVRSEFKPITSLRFLEFKKLIWPFTEMNTNRVQWDENVMKIYGIAEFEKEAGSNPSTFRMLVPIRPSDGSTLLLKACLLSIRMTLVIVLILLTAALLFVRRQNEYQVAPRPNHPILQIQPR